jgi:hypothetical protein
MTESLKRDCFETFPSVSSFDDLSIQRICGNLLPERIESNCFGTLARNEAIEIWPIAVSAIVVNNGLQE